MMKLPFETFERKEKRLPVAQYVRDREDRDWDEWLQTHRVELDAMTATEFIEWLDTKIAPFETGKVVPPPKVIKELLDEQLKQVLRNEIVERVLREAKVEKQVDQEFQRRSEILRKQKRGIRSRIESELSTNEHLSWRNPVNDMAEKIAKSMRGK